MSTNQDTIEELSKKAGHKTLINQSSNESHLDMDNKITKSADQERIITFDRLSQLIEGKHWSFVHYTVKIIIERKSGHFRYLILGKPTCPTVGNFFLIG